MSLFAAQYDYWVAPLGTVGLLFLGSLATWLVLYALCSFFLPRVTSIARATVYEAVTTPVALVLVGVGTFLILIFPYIPANTFGQDVKELKGNGLVLLMLLGVGLGIWTSSKALSKELEGRTALLVLAKPISRLQFMLGKYLGVLALVALLFVILGNLFLVTVSYEVAYDARESVTFHTDGAQKCREAVATTIPGVILAFLEAAVLSSIAIALSTRLSALPNLVICITLYLLGHLTPTLVAQGQGAYGLVAWMAKLLATIVPVLDHFNITTAIMSDNPVPWSYVGQATCYAVLYCALAMVLGLLMFEDREVA